MFAAAGLSQTTWDALERHAVATCGERVRIDPDAILRRQVRERFATAVEWEPIGLPQNYLPLIAGGRAAFVAEKDRIVCHGGIAIEEVIVPLVEIQRRAV